MSVIELTTENFEKTVTQPGIVVLDFWASWCGPCRAFAPIFKKVSEQFPDATFAKLNTEENRELSTALQIRSIPTLMVFRDGVLLFKQPGMVPEKALKGLVDQIAELDMDEVRAEMEAKKTEEANSAP